mmetsp:Transcript_67871/g.171146  ORF Transcript_67871/g.171146 Transcript_67871/m.171146 type:complete len:214 (+) Transcript_67871:3587-4228(+)
MPPAGAPLACHRRCRAGRRRAPPGRGRRLRMAATPVLQTRQPCRPLPAAMQPRTVCLPQRKSPAWCPTSRCRTSSSSCCLYPGLRCRLCCSSPIPRCQLCCRDRGLLSPLCCLYPSRCYSPCRPSPNPAGPHSVHCCPTNSSPRRVPTTRHLCQPALDPVLCGTWPHKAFSAASPSSPPMAKSLQPRRKQLSNGARARGLCRRRGPRRGPFRP